MLYVTQIMYNRWSSVDRALYYDTVFFDQILQKRPRKQAPATRQGSLFLFENDTVVTRTLVCRISLLTPTSDFVGSVQHVKTPTFILERTGCIIDNKYGTGHTT